MEYAFLYLKKTSDLCASACFPDIDAPFIVETDASRVAVGAVLEQKGADGKAHPIYFASKTTSNDGRNYSACEREALAINFALRNFRHYLLPEKHFSVITDHKALEHAFKRRYMHGTLAHWMDFIAEYKFSIK